MRKNLFRAKCITSFVLVFFILFFSCSRDRIIPVHDHSPPVFSVKEAQRYYQEGVKEIKAPQLSRGKVTTKSQGGQRTLTPDWSKAVAVNLNRSVVVQVPVRERINESIMMIDKQSDKMSVEMIENRTMLVVEQFNETGAIRHFVTTILGVSDKNRQEKVDPYTYSGDRSSFTGFMIISDEEGNYLYSFVYKNGKRRHVGVFNSGEHPELLQQKEYLGFKILHDDQRIETKGGGGNCPECSEPESECVCPSICPICNELLYFGICLECDYFELEDAVGTFCSVCFERINECVCCIHCGTPNCDGACQNHPDYCPNCFEEEGNCFCCPFCFSPFCFGECIECPYCATPFCSGECQGCSICLVDPCVCPQTCTHTKCAYSECGACISGTGTAGQNCTYCSDQGNHATPNIDVIYDSNSTLTQAQKYQLETAITEFKSKFPAFAALYNALVNSGLTFTFKIDPNIDGLASYKLDGTISFLNENAIKCDNLEEELIHAKQHIVYGNAFTDKIKNYEFETRVFKDLSCAYTGSSCINFGSMGQSDQFSAQYGYWMAGFDLGNPFSSNDITMFMNFCSSWTYPKGTFEISIIPQLILDYFN